MQPADQLDRARIALLGDDLSRARYRVDAVRELWGEGSRLNADELLADVAGEELEMEAFAESLRELLK